MNLSLEYKCPRLSPYYGNRRPNAPDPRFAYMIGQREPFVQRGDTAARQRYRPTRIARRKPVGP